MQALCFDDFGGPAVLSFRERPDPEPRRGHAVVRLEAIGLNFADIYRRRGAYHLAGPPPYVAGYEGAGIVESLGAEDGASSGFQVGQRVGFADSPFANAEKASVALERLIPLPDGLASETAAAVLLQGMTAQYLVRDSHPLKANETAVVHAAGGGVGLLLVQIVKIFGGRVVALASSEAKRDAAREAGADEAFVYGGDWPKRVLEATGLRGADVVFDSVGTTLLGSLAAVRVGGRVVFFGMAGGNPPLVDPALLMDQSKTLTGGDLWNVLTSAEERRRRAAELFEWVLSGRLTVTIARRFALAEGAAAHAYLESRASVGKVLLIP